MKFLAISASILTCLSPVLHSSTLNVNFEIGTNSSGDELASIDSAGIISSTNWNNISVGNNGTHAVNIPTTLLNNNSGVATTATIAANLGTAYVGASGSGSSTTDHKMMSGYVAWDPVDGTTPEDTGTITISNLPANFTAGYKVYVYFDADVNNRTFDVTVNGTTISGADSATFSGEYLPGAAAAPANANYALFSGLTANSFTIAMNSNTGRAAINGIQIVSNDHAVPPTIESFTANDHYVSSGTGITLNWQTTDATSISIDQSVGNVTGISTDGDGNISANINATTTYTLTASNSSGSVVKTLKIGVGPPRPNILLFVVDDMGSQDTSEPFQVDSSGNDVPSTLNARYKTPHMQALAANGMKFTHAYAIPVCTPTRCSLMNGQNSARHHVTNWTSPSYNGETGNNTIPSHNSPLNWRRTGLDVSSGSLPSILSGAGYRSIHAGKAHFGNDTANKDPLNVGFDVNIAGGSIGHPGSYTGTYGQGGSHAVPGLSAYHNTGTFLTEALTLEMNKAIEDSVNDGVPFFAYMSHYAVHAPFQSDPRFTANYPTLSGNALAFATMIEGMDKSLGDIVAKINALGVGEDTLVIFISDNGSDSPSGSAPLRGKKGTKYEGGSRVPMITAWATPNPLSTFQTTLNIPANSYEDDIVTCFDIFPTILSVANVSHTNVIDGHDLSSYLKATAGTHRPQELLIHFPHDHNSDYYTFYREGPYKLIYNYAPNTYELYNVVTDISEATDLAASDPNRVMAMARKMAIALDAHGAQWPTFDTSPTDTDDPHAMPSLPAVDLDNDGVPDNDEDANGNGIVDPNETNPDNDNSDGDNVKDGSEIKLGTDPLDATSFFKLEQSFLPNGDLQITWDSAPGSTFALSSTAKFDGWTVIASGIPASAGTTTSYNVGQPTAVTYFYRLELE